MAAIMTIDTAVLTAMSGVLGSLVGGSATVAATWIGQRTLHRREQIGLEMRKRETLYGEFISECARLLVDAFAHTLEKPDVLLPAYALINRIRLCATPAVLEEAERMLKRITQQYFASNLSVDELRRLTLSEKADPLKAFGDVCRTELNAMRIRL